MTSEEAQKVAAIAVTADGGCCDCAGGLLAQMWDAWPEHRGVWFAVYREGVRR